MRRLALLGLVAACGNDPGLLLDVHAGGGDVVNDRGVPARQHRGRRHGPAAGRRTSSGEDAGHDLHGDRQRDGHGIGRSRATILLKPGDRTDVPALLVLGYDAQPHGRSRTR